MIEFLFYHGAEPEGESAPMVERVGGGISLGLNQKENRIF